MILSQLYYCQNARDIVIGAGEISIIWSKEDAAKTIIAMGTMVLDQEYKDRATVKVDEKGSTLTIGIAKAQDAGQYKCSVAVEKNPPEVKHTVAIRGELERIKTE